MLDDDKPKDGQLNPEGWEEYATPQSPNHNWAIERDDFKTNYALAHEFKAFMEENFIKKSNSPALSKGAQIMIDAVEKLPLVFKNDGVLKLSKLKELKAQSENSYVDFTNKYIEQFKNIAKSITARTKGSTPCREELEQVIKSERERSTKSSKRKRRYG